METAAQITAKAAQRRGERPRSTTAKAAQIAAKIAEIRANSSKDSANSSKSSKNSANRSKIRRRGSRTREGVLDHVSEVRYTCWERGGAQQDTVRQYLSLIHI
eukprot:1385234-Rhodomonas_salina.1